MLNNETSPKTDVKSAKRVRNSRIKNKPKVTVSQLEKQCKALKDQVKKLTQSLALVKRTINVSKQKQLEARHLTLSNALHVMIERVSISTELRWYAVHESTPPELRQKVLSFAVQYLDMPDDIVKKDADLSIGQVVKRLLKNEEKSLENVV